MNKRYPERHKFTDPKSNLDTTGGGFGYPITVNKTGEVELQTGTKYIGSCIKHFAMYSYTDLVGTPSFGGGLLDSLWKLMTSNTMGIRETQMREGLEYWEPRIEDVQVSVGKTIDNPNGLTAKVTFKKKVTGDTEFLRFSVPIEGKN